MKKFIILNIVLLSFTANAQRINVLKSKNYGKNPEITWYCPGNDTLNRDFSVWRAGVNDKKFKQINTKTFLFTHKKDTVLYYVSDSTLNKKGIYQYYIKVTNDKDSIMTSAIAYGHNLGSIPRPQIVDFNYQNVKDKKAIQLNWKLNYNFSVRTVSIFRGDTQKNYQKIAELSGSETQYIDPVPLSHHNYFYFFLIADYFGYQYPSVRFPAHSLYKSKTFAPMHLSYKQKDNTINLHWENADTLYSGYTVFKAENEGTFRPMHIMQSVNDKEVNFLDSITKKYLKKVKYYVVNYSDAYVASTPSDTLTIYFKNTEKPLPPNELNALTKDDKIKFIWDIPMVESVVGYNIYCIEPQKSQLNKEMIYRHQNHFEINTPKKPGLYVYQLKSLDQEGNESEFGITCTAKVLKPYYKVLLDASKTGRTVQLKWKQLPQTKISSIILYRQKENESPVLVKKFKNEEQTYNDKDLEPGILYRYYLMGTLTNGKNIYLNSEVSIVF